MQFALSILTISRGSEGIGFGCTHTLLSRNIDKLFVRAYDERRPRTLSIQGPIVIRPSQLADEDQVTSTRKEVADDAIKAIRDEFGDEKTKRFIWIQCDLSDWEQTAKVANDIASQTDRIDILVCNAARGIMTRQLAPTNGIDLHMATNQYVSLSAIIATILILH